MKNSRILALLTVFVLLGAAVYLLEKSRERKAEHVPSELGLMYPDFDANRVRSIVFGSFANTVVLAQIDDAWFVEDEGKWLPADAEAIESVFTTTSHLEAIQIVSRNPDNHITFQVNASRESEFTDESGDISSFTVGTMGTEVVITYDDDTEAAHFFVGKNGTMDIMTTYVRKHDSDTVLLAPGYLKMIYGKGDATAWKDLLLCRFQPEEIASITLGKGDDAIILEALIEESDSEKRPEITWHMTQPDRGVVPQSSMQQMLTMLQHFRATDFADIKENVSEYGFDDSNVYFSVVLRETGESREFLFGALSDTSANHYYLLMKGSELIYLIPRYRINAIPSSPDDLFPA